MSSNMRIVNICEYCKQEFIARKTTTQTCSDPCAKRLYKLRERGNAIRQPIEIFEYFVYGEHDLAFLRVDKKAIAEQKVFPKIIDPSKIAQGTSLCKFGYPFVEVKATFNNSNNAFELPKDLLPVPAFPIEGIYTRNLLIGKTQDQSMDILYLETSLPGLRGQSGGPICDTNGNIYAIQSKNLTVPLGFKGAIEIGKKMVEENQFLNIGIGVHPKTIVDLLNKHDIKVDLVN